MTASRTRPTNFPLTMLHASTSRAYDLQASRVAAVSNPVLAIGMPTEAGSWRSGLDSSHGLSSLYVRYVEAGPFV